MSSNEWFSGEPNLKAWEAEIWQNLHRSANDKDSGWRLGNLGTSNEGLVRQRIVVLRKVAPDLRTIFAHTDVRSAKIETITSNSNCSWLFYDLKHQVQLHLSGTTQIHTVDNVAETMWQEEAESSLRGYLGHLAPGTLTEEPEHNLPDMFRDRLPDRQELTAARKNFAVLQCRVTSAEIVVLNRSGNLRAYFDYSADTPQMSWMAP